MWAFEVWGQLLALIKIASDSTRDHSDPCAHCTCNIKFTGWGNYALALKKVSV